MKFSTIIFLLALCAFQAHYGFNNLSDLQQLAQQYPEFPAINIENWNDPDYTDFHTQLLPSWWQYFRSLIGLPMIGTWDKWQFKTVLEDVVKEREDEQLYGNMVARLTVDADTQFYIWGDMHGAYHSLVRDLTYLHEQDVITSELEIKNDKTFLVFNGDFIDRSPFNVQTLHVALLLMKKNPKQVYYLRGNHEDKKHWQNYGLKRELINLAHSTSLEEIPLGTAINQLFYTLPLALFITTPYNPTSAIRISHSNRTQNKINEHALGDLFENQKLFEPVYYDMTNDQKTTHSIDVKTIITSEDSLKEQRAQLGMGSIDQDLGATSWALLSSPIEIHRTFYGLEYDSFAQLTIKEPITQSTITLYNQDIRTLLGFKKYKTFNAFTTIPEDHPAFNQPVQDDIKVGSSMALVRGWSVVSQRLKRAIEIVFKNINQTGGINGRHIRSYILNDNYLPHLARQNIIRLLKNDTSMILMSTGSPTLTAYLNYVKEGKVLAIFPVTGGEQFREPTLPNIINYRASYDQETRALVNYLFKEFGMRKFAFFYQDDSFGQGPLAAAHDELKKNNVTDWVDIAYTRGTVNFSSQVDKIKNSQPEALCFLSLAEPTREFIRQLGVDLFANMRLCAISPLADEAFREFDKQLGLRIVYAAVVPNPYNSQLPIVEEYRTAMDENNFPYDTASLEGYIGAELFTDVLNKITGTITNENVLEAFKALNNYQYKGLVLTYNPKQNDLSQKVYIETGRDGQWIEQNVISKSSDTDSSSQTLNSLHSELKDSI